MYTRQELVKNIKNMGILPNDTLLVHTSLKSVGKTEEGADTLLDALCECVCDGLLVIPSHTWSYIGAQNPQFSVLESPSCVGILPEVFRKRNGVYRSLHPTHSLLAYGRGAEEFVSGQEKFDTPCAPDSCYGMLEKKSGKVLLIGVDFSRCTLVHCIEEVACVPDRMTDSYQQLYVQNAKGENISVPSRRHHNANSDHYVKLEPVLDYRHILQRGKIGDAKSIMCNVPDLFRVAIELLRKNPRLFDDFTPVPEEWF